MPKLTQTPQSRRDLVEIAAYISQFNEDAAYRFLIAAEKALDNLLLFPGMGARREVRDPRFSALRSWPITGFRNYLIYYSPTRRGIRVHRVMHGARDVRKVFGR